MSVDIILIYHNLQIFIIKMINFIFIIYIYTVYNIHIITTHIMFIYNDCPPSNYGVLFLIITHDKNTIAGMCGTLLRFPLRFNYSLTQPTMFFHCIIFEVWSQYSVMDKIPSLVVADVTCENILSSFKQIAFNIVFVFRKLAKYKMVFNVCPSHMIH